MMANHNIQPRYEVLRYYFYFMQERMNIFWRKCDGEQKLTNDPILKKYKFTNVYRACDRVSQYLIKNVIYKDLDKYSPEDVLLRILVFKIFNKIQTWEYLNHVLDGYITIDNFDAHHISSLLTLYQLQHPIFNNAYMMTGSHHSYNDLPTKHERWLTMVQREFIDKHLFSRILVAKSLEEVYNILKNCSFIGPFLAYQYAIDFNYSPYLNFSENSFVKAGIGAIRGIKKCFISYGENYEDAIYYIYKNQKELRQKFGYNRFLALPNHEPSLIDFQNCFCETDKYLRAAMPDLLIGNIRIKQKYKPTNKIIDYCFPEKWHVNKNFQSLCLQPNIQELTISW